MGKDNNPAVVFETLTAGESLYPLPGNIEFLSGERWPQQFRNHSQGYLFFKHISSEPLLLSQQQIASQLQDANPGYKCPYCNHRPYVYRGAYFRHLNSKHAV